MSVVEENIKRINDKLQLLLRQFQITKKANEQLSIELKELKNLRENDLLRMAQLEQQAQILKSASGQLNEKEKKLFEKAIDQYIKEIDKCIGLLSE